MSAPGPSGSEDAPTHAERAERLKHELIVKFGERRGLELFRKTQEATLNRIGTEATISVLNASDVAGLLGQIWTDGLAGLSSGELLKIENFLNDHLLRHRRMLRFIRYYVQDDEYAAVDTSFQLMARIQDRATDPENRSRTIRSLYDRIGRLRYGRRVYNQVSVGWLENLTYPQMKSLEERLSPAGRVRGSQKEQVAQVFYRSLESDPTKLWVKSIDSPSEVFGEVCDRLGVAGTYTERPVPYLDVYAVGHAELVRDSAVADFLSSYGQYQMERHDSADRVGAGFLRLQRAPRS